MHYTIFGQMVKLLLALLDHKKEGSCTISVQIDLPYAGKIHALHTFYPRAKKR